VTSINLDVWGWLSRVLSTFPGADAQAI
jgi:hypothetical protein